MNSELNYLNLIYVEIFEMMGYAELIIDLQIMLRFEYEKRIDWGH